MPCVLSPHMFCCVVKVVLSASREVFVEACRLTLHSLASSVLCFENTVTGCLSARYFALSTMPMFMVTQGLGQHPYGSRSSGSSSLRMSGSSNRFSYTDLARAQKEDGSLIKV